MLDNTYWQLRRNTNTYHPLKRTRQRNGASPRESFISFVGERIQRFQRAAIRHSNIYRILVRITDAIIGVLEEKRVSLLLRRRSASPAALNPPSSLFARRFSRFSSSNPATRPCRSVSLRGTRKPFPSCALCVYPLSTFLLFSATSHSPSLQPSNTLLSWTFQHVEQVVNATRRCRCNCARRNIAPFDSLVGLFFSTKDMNRWRFTSKRRCCPVNCTFLRGADANHQVTIRRALKCKNC